MYIYVRTWRDETFISRPYKLSRVYSRIFWSSSEFVARRTRRRQPRCKIPPRWLNILQPFRNRSFELIYSCCNTEAKIHFLLSIQRWPPSEILIIYDPPSSNNAIDWYGSPYSSNSWFLFRSRKQKLQRINVHAYLSNVSLIYPINEMSIAFLLFIGNASLI